MVRSPTHAHAERRKGWKISQEYSKKVPTLPFSLVAWWRLRAFFHGENKINWQLVRRYGERLPWETRLPLTHVNTSDLSLGAARKTLSIPAPSRTQSSELLLKSSWRMERSYPSPSATGVLKAYLSMRHLFSRKTHTVWPKAPHKPNKLRSCPNRFQIAHPIGRFFVRMSMCMRACVRGWIQVPNQTGLLWRAPFKTQNWHHPLCCHACSMIKKNSSSTKKTCSVVFSVIKALFLQSMTTTQQHQHHSGLWIDGPEKCASQL